MVWYFGSQEVLRWMFAKSMDYTRPVDRPVFPNTSAAGVVVMRVYLKDQVRVLRARGRRTTADLSVISQ